MAYSREFLEKTLNLFQPYSKEPLTHLDAEEMTRNMVQYFELLIEMDKKQNGQENRRKET